MKRFHEIMLIPLAMAGVGLATQTWAQYPPPGQERRAECQKQADEKGLRGGSERQSFMRQCVHGSAAKPAPAAAKPAVPATPAEPAKPAKAAEPAKAPAPQDRMADCQKQANDKSLRGPDRRDFMSKCMKK